MISNGGEQQYSSSLSAFVSFADCQCSISIKRWFKSPSVAFTKRLQNTNPEDRRSSVPLASFCLFEKQKGFHRRRTAQLI